VNPAEALRSEVFALAYHLKWSPSEILALPVTERRAYLRLLADQLERERRAAEERVER
jgi:heme exporter protein D